MVILKLHLSASGLDILIPSAAQTTPAGSRASNHTGPLAWYFQGAGKFYASDVYFRHFVRKLQFF
jgi:hypothetical protein